MNAARHPHSFLGINREGRTSIIQTTGNTDVHMVLRGGKKPNYLPEDITRTEEMLEKGPLPHHHGRLQPRQLRETPREAA